MEESCILVAESLVTCPKKSLPFSSGKLIHTPNHLRLLADLHPNCATSGSSSIVKPSYTWTMKVCNTMAKTLEKEPRRPILGGSRIMNLHNNLNSMSQVSSGVSLVATNNNNAHINPPRSHDYTHQLQVKTNSKSNQLQVNTLAQVATKQSCLTSACRAPARAWGT